MSADEALVRVEHVSKKFARGLRRSLWYGLRDIGGEILGRGGGPLELRRDEFLAVDNVSFEVRRGECLGLIGANGAGKSTLLKMLNGLIDPDGGRIEIRGRVGALIELGAGFNPVLTGRENVYVNGAILGLAKREIDARYQEIVDFAELAEFIDAPVQTYSSGMRVRLGFAVAVHVQPDILLIDEVLAVGDMAFVLKCFNAMEARLADTAMILVSHSMPQVSRVCTRAICLDHGRVAATGSTGEAIDAYLSRLEKPPGNFTGEPGTEIRAVRFAGGAAEGRLRHLDDLELEIELLVPARFSSPVLYLAIFDRELRGVAETEQSAGSSLRNDGEPMRVRVQLPRLNLSRGVYTVTVAVKSAARGRILGRFQSVASFRVEGESTLWLPIHLESQFEQRE